MHPAKLYSIYIPTDIHTYKPGTAAAVVFLDDERAAATGAGAGGAAARVALRNRHSIHTYIHT